MSIKYMSVSSIAVATKMLYLIFLLMFQAVAFKFPDSCGSGQFYDSILMDCRACPLNVSLVPAVDRFGCECAENSIPTELLRCKPCPATSMISSDGSTCIPRRCQSSNGRIVCRKCPTDYITVTQNFDGSPMKEATCLRCARGFRAQNNKCVKCETCTCKSDVVVSGRCLPRSFVMERPDYKENVLHPNTLLDIVKQEYMCNHSDIRACHALSQQCVRNFYMLSIAGPCRYWLQPNLTHPALPPLTIDAKENNEIILSRGKNSELIALALFNLEGGVELYEDVNLSGVSCLPPILIKLGEDYTTTCSKNISKIDESEYGTIYELYLPTHGNYKPLPVTLLQPTGHYVQKGIWPSGKFRKFFYIDKSLSTMTNITQIIYLRKLLIRMLVQRGKDGALRLYINNEVHFSLKSPNSQVIATTLSVIHEMPSAGVLRGIEIIGGTFVSVLSLYALVQWRCVVRRGGLQLSLLPLLSGAVSDGLYFSALLSTLHALAAEAGTLGITLPLSRLEEDVLMTILYVVVLLKIVRVIWINWKQCHNDIFFIDWLDYNTSVMDPELSIPNSVVWRSALLSNEWIIMQTKRRVYPLNTVVVTLLVLYIAEGWRYCVPKSPGYFWAFNAGVWWISYSVLFVIYWIKCKAFGSPTERILKLCSGLDLSLFVFQEEFYAHYVHGRNNSDGISKFSGPLTSCRVVCATQFRDAYKKLSNTNYTSQYRDVGGSNKVLLSKFMAAFIERALDGVSWVAKERSLFERLLDFEMTAREGSSTSTLLYDAGTTPSCFDITWWGEEWTLVTFEAMLFGCLSVVSHSSLLAALITVTTWQIGKNLRDFFAFRNLRNKISMEM